MVILWSRIKLYLVIQKANLDSKRSYVFNFYTGMLTLLLNSITPIISFWLLTNYFDNIGGWNFHEILLMYSLWRISNGFYLTFLHHQVSGFDRMLISGEFDFLLIRPHHPLFMFFSKKFNPDGLGDIMTGIIGASWAFSVLNIPWIDFVGYMIYGITGGIIISSVFLIISSLSFWTMQSDGIRDVASRFNNTFQSYPISIYNGIIKLVLTFILPFAFTGYFPVQAFFSQAKPTTFSSFFIYLSPVIALIMFIASISIWNLGLRSYKSAGS